MSQDQRPKLTHMYSRNLRVQIGHDYVRARAILCRTMFSYLLDNSGWLVLALTELVSQHRPDEWNCHQLSLKLNKNAYRRIKCKTSESRLQGKCVISVKPRGVSRQRKKSDYLDDLKTLAIQGDRGFRNRVDKVVHGNHKLDTSQKSCKERERQWGRR